MVEWLFLPQNFGLVVGTYEGLLPFCECTWGGGSIWLCLGDCDTSTLYAITELFELFALRGGGKKKTSSNYMGMRPHAPRQLELSQGDAT